MLISQEEDSIPHLIYIDFLEAGKYPAKSKSIYIYLDYWTRYASAIIKDKKPGCHHLHPNEEGLFSPISTPTVCEFTLCYHNYCVSDNLLCKWEIDNVYDFY